MFAESVRISATDVPENFLWGKKKFQGAKFQIMPLKCTGTNEGTEKKHKTAKSFRVLIYYKFCKL